MNTFFSIIYLTLNASLKERISVGMIMSNGKDVKFKISNTKLSIVKQLIPNQNYNFLKSYFKNLDKELILELENSSILDLSTEKTNNWINEKYFSYLHRYSNNIVEFSEPKKINISLDEITFHNMYVKYVFGSDLQLIPSKSKDDIVRIVKDKLYSRIKSKVNLDATVKPNDFKELISPVNVNFIGKNGKIVSGQTIDFEKRYVDLERDLTKYISFTKAVDYQFGSGKYFLVGNEPDKKISSKNHSIWKHIFKSHIVQYVDVNETDRIKDYINSKGVLPYFEKEDSE